jgi:hypothetical protein
MTRKETRRYEIQDIIRRAKPKEAEREKKAKKTIIGGSTSKPML